MYGHTRSSSRPRRVLVLTGAGVSAESGLATFRGAGGLWEGEPAEAVATPAGFVRDPERVWRFYGGLRQAVAGVEPNEAHRALAAAERQMGKRFLLVTQNVDGLHQRAGSIPLELHGSLWRTRCSGCDRPAFEDRSIPASPPCCDRCGAYLRPAVTWFGEPVELDPDWLTKRFIKDAEWSGERLVFLAVGTSGFVAPASRYVRYARDFGAETWVANLERPENDDLFDRVVVGPATELVPRLLDELAS